MSTKSSALLLSLVLLAGILTGPVVGQSVPDAIVTVVGRATSGDPSLPLAREAALQDALRNAIQQVVGVLLTSTTLVENYELVRDRISSQTAGVAYLVRVVDEGYAEDGSYRIVAEVAVREASVEALLRSAIQAIGDPRVVIQVHGQPKSLTATVLHEVQSLVVGQGFYVLIEQSPPAVMTSTLEGGSIGADMIVQIRYEVTENATPIAAIREAGLASADATLVVDVIDASTGRVILTEARRVTRPASTFDLAAKEAVVLSIERLAPQLEHGLRAWVQGISETRRTVLIRLSGIASFEDVQGLMTGLEVWLSTDVHLRQFIGSEAIIELVHTGRIEMVLLSLSELGWTITMVEGGNVAARLN